MRHRIAHRKLNRTCSHRVALRRNLAQSLIEHGQVRTTLAKAKDLRSFVEKIITLARQAHGHARKGDPAAGLRARRQIHKLLGERSIIPPDHQSDYDAMSDAKRRQTLRMPSGRRYRLGEPKGRLAFTGGSIVHHLMEKVAPRFSDRPGGYTRIIRLADRRVGDHGPLAVLELIGDETAPSSLVRPARGARKRRADRRYAAAIKSAKAATARGAGRAPSEREERGGGPSDQPQPAVGGSPGGVAASGEAPGL